MKNVYLAGAVRTPIGKFGGTLTSWTAVDLGVAAAKEGLRRARVPVEKLTSRSGAVRVRPVADQTLLDKSPIAAVYLKWRQLSL